MSGDCPVPDQSENSVNTQSDDNNMETMETETIVEEFVRLKLKQSAGIVQRRRTSTDMETQALIGRLIEISNELEAQYGERLNRDAEVWIRSATYEKFLQIATGVFSDGIINWSRIVVLFMFAVKVVVNAISKGLGGLASDVIRLVVKFIFIHGIYKWVQSHGGWVAVLREYTPHSSSSGLFVFGLTLLIFCLLLTRKI
ncbi:Bcl-2 homologous antagonist/killer [Schistosoma japonicum]|uniref:Bcl-2 homologous antagonist/killer n=1 Tax=Schistosoma japonicum TaxID=6182 RepID=A0A4Z2DY07_SCHJA|nr:apoptosis regulator bax [Schistosoma japonicum]KAH8866110.1 apoptosis regulator bax [Schistosoma japonicum]TNN21441.1 Bcl-2 homologous antagonist/killer [Schistosoma japonicum]